MRKLAWLVVMLCACGGPSVKPDGGTMLPPDDAGQPMQCSDVQPESAQSWCGVVIGRSVSKRVARVSGGTTGRDYRLSIVGASQFTVDQGPTLHVGAGSTVAVDVSFTATEANEQPLTAQVRIETDDCETPTVVGLSARGITQSVEAKESLLNFGFVRPGTTVSRTLELINHSDEALPLQLNVSGQEYSVDPTTLTLPACDARSVTARFAPMVLGRRDAVLLVGGGAVTVPLVGYGGGPQIEAPTTIDLGVVPFFDPSQTGGPPFFVSRTLLVKNVGDDIQNAELKFADMAVTVRAEPNSPPGLEVGDPDLRSLMARPGLDTARLPLAFRPTQIGTYAFRVTLHTNDPLYADFEIRVTADVQVLPPCNATITPSSIDFGELSAPNPARRTIRIRNNATQANENCLISGVELQPSSYHSFSLAPNTPQTVSLGPGQVHEIEVVATPASTSAPTIAGTVELGLSDPMHPKLQIPLTAMQVSQCVVLAPNQWHFGSVSPGCRPQARRLAIHNRCDLPVTLASITADCGGPTPCPFTVSALPVQSLAAFSSTSVDVTFAPTTTGPAEAAIVLAGQRFGAFTTVLTVRGEAAPNAKTIEQLGTPREVDALVALDVPNDGYRIALAAEASTLLQYPTAGALDYRLGFVHAASMPALIHQNNEPSVVTATALPSPADSVRSRLAQGVGQAPAKCGEQLVGAFDRTVFDGTNAALVRPDSALGLACFTSQADTSAQPIPMLIDQLLNLRGFNRPNLISFSVMGPFSPASTCGVDVDTGGRHAALAAGFYGVRFDVCDTALGDETGTMMQSLSPVLFGRREQHFLSHPQATPGQLEVRVGGQLVTTGWSYEAATNSIRWQPASAPAPGTSVTATYQQFCQ